MCVTEVGRCSFVDYWKYLGLSRAGSTVARGTSVHKKSSFACSFNNDALILW